LGIHLSHLRPIAAIETPRMRVTGLV
jgi:hypothetical protein